jgi:hypothetical protein
VTSPASPAPESVDLELRQPPVALVLFAVSLVIAAGLMVTFLRQAPFDAAFSLGFPVFLAGIMAFNLATVLSRVQALSSGRLVVRNRLRSRTVERGQVDRVIVGRQAGFASPRRLELLLTDGTTVRLIATEVPPLPGLRGRLEGQAEQLRAWVAGTTTPYR